MQTVNTNIVQMNKQFEELNKSLYNGSHRYYYVMGSAGSGKSVDVARMLIVMLSSESKKGMNLLVIRKKKNSHHNSTLQELVKAIRALGLQDQWLMPKNLSSGVLSLKHRSTGNEIKFEGIKNQDDIETIKSITFSSGALTTIWVEEATEIRHADFEILDDRLRGDLKEIYPDNYRNLRFQIILSFNPISPAHWIKKKCWDVEDDKAFKSHSTYLGNRFCDEEFHARMMRRKRLDPEGYKIYGLGEWGELGGLILPNVKEVDLSKSNRYCEDIVYGQDFGFNHANAILEVGILNGDLYVMDEIYVREKTTAEIIQLANQKGFSKKIRMNCDSAEPDRIKEWRNAGFNAFPVKKKGDKIITGSGQSEQSYINSQIDWLKQRTIYIDKKCTYTLNEIQQWKWQKDERTGEYTDKPVNILDDAMAALRYASDFFRVNDGMYFLE